MKTAIITGTSSGLGEGFARALLDLGWKVYGISRRDASPELISHENFRQLQMDLERPIDKKLLKETIKEKEIALLVNNAGFCLLGDADRWNINDYQKTFQVQYVAPMELISLFADKISNGRVINILSDSAAIGWEKYGIYGASKAALLRNTESLARERPDIGVYNLQPSGVDTPIIETLDPQMLKDRPNFMKVKDVVTVFVQLITGVLEVPSGASITLHNDWEAEEMAEIHANEYIYNVDTEQLTKLPL